MPVFHKIGQRVICINPDVDGQFLHPAKYQRAPRKNEILTVDGVMSSSGNWKFPDSRQSVHLKEIGGRGYWSSERFRPIVERPTDISIFTKLLDTSKIDEKEWQDFPPS